MHEVIDINNLKLIFSPLPNMESASLGVFIRIGSRFEKKSLKGIAHFLEHMVFKGTRNYSHRRITREIEGRGGFLNAFTSQEITAYHANFLRKNFQRTLDILLDLVYRPLLKDSDVARERNVILEEIKMYHDLPSSRAGMLLGNLLWRGHPLGEEVIGHAATVMAIQRASLQDFRNRYYIPSNMVISLCGDFRKEDVCRIILARTKKIDRRVNLTTVLPAACRGLRIATEKKHLQQSHLCLGFRSVSYRSSQRLALSLLNVILGANMSSRLFEELREKKSLCYDVSTEAKHFKDSGAFLIHAGLDRSKVATALAAILKELEKLKSRGVRPKELSRAKDYLLGQIAMSLEVPQGRMWHFAHDYLTVGKIHDFRELKKKIDSISESRIKTLAEKTFTFEDMCISCVGNIEEGLKEKMQRIAA
jgi:predicted Zn-dependent peptidase